MMDYQRLVDELRSVLQSSDPAGHPRLKELAAAFTQACQETNQRLRRCEDYMRQGMRSEAVQLAQADSLLTQVGVLDIAEFDYLEQLCQRLGLPAPPHLLLAIAAALDEAPAEVKPLEALLREHRLLALSRAPLTDRLKVMRQLAQLDAGTPVWEDDIREFERTRLQHLQVEIDRSTRQPNTETLVAAWQEIHEPGWRLQPPAALVNQLEKLVTHSVRQQARAKLAEIDIKLKQAVVLEDAAQARQLRQQWQELARDAELGPNDPLREGVAKALAWLDKQDRLLTRDQEHYQALQELQQALDCAASDQQLQRCYHALLRHERGVPALVQQRYQERMKHLTSRSTQRDRLVLAATFSVGVLVLVGLFVFFGFRGSQAFKMNDAAARLKDLREEKRWKDAWDYFDDLEQQDPRIANSPPVQEQRDLLAKEEKKEKERRASFDKALHDYELLALEAPDDPALGIVRHLANTGKETEMVNRAQARRAEALQLRHDDAIEPHVKALEDQVRQLKELMEDPAQTADVVNKVGLFRDELRRLTPKKEQLSKTMQGRLQELKNQADTAANRLEQLNPEVQLAKEMTAALQNQPNLEKYLQAMSKYQVAFPDKRRGKDFKRAQDELPLWQETLAWTELVQPGQGKALDLTAAEAKPLAEKASGFLQTHPSFGQAAIAGKYLAALQALALQSDEDKDSPGPKLRQLFQEGYVKNLWIIKTKTDQVYYLKVNPVDIVNKAKLGKKDTVSFPYLKDLDDSPISGIVALDEIDNTCQAPQSKVGQEALALLDQVPKTPWETAMIDIARKIKDSSDMDPILKVQLLIKVLPEAGKGSYPLALALAKHQDLLNKKKIPLTSWSDPKDKDAPKARTSAREVLKELPSLEPVLKEAVEQKRKLEETLAQATPALVGWLARDGERFWTCQPVKVDWPGEYELFTVVPGPDAAGKWQPIGRLAGGKAFIDSGLGEEILVEGRLVFARKVQAH